MTFTYTAPTALTLVSATQTEVTFEWDASELIANNIVLLVHADGVNGSTTVTDTSGNNASLSLFGTAALSTSSPKFGSASLHFASINTGAGDEVRTQILQHAPLDILSGTGDFTIDGWFWINGGAAPGSQFIIFDYGDGLTGVFDAGMILVAGTDNFQLDMGISQNNNPTNVWAHGGVTGTAGFVTTDTWHHFAVVRSSGAGAMYLDGVGITLGTASTHTWTNYFGLTGGFPAHTSYLRLNQSFATGGAENPGKIDEFKVTKAALWTSNFTPPTAPTADPGPPVGYTVFRDTVEIGQILLADVTEYIDTNVFIGHTYSYTVAAQDGSDVLVSDFSSPLSVTIPAGAGSFSGAFAPAATYPPILLANVKGARPRIYMPQENITVVTKP